LPRREEAEVHRLTEPLKPPGTPRDTDRMTARRLMPATAAALAALAAGAAVPAEAQRAVRPLGIQAPLGNERLSDETRLTRLAHPVTRWVIRALPTRASRAVGRLRLSTEDGPPEVYLILSSQVQESTGRVWLKIRVPGRPNGRKGWVPRDALGGMFVVRTRLVVNRRTLRATLYRNGRPTWSSRVGVGEPSTPTPAGQYWIRSRLRNLRGSPIYGPWAFGTAAYSRLSDWPGGGVVGVHGTNQPWLIPGRPSHGCIRVPNRKIRRLARIMPLGTPVQII
jgi:L,D-transpeptidase catalytic domain